MSLTAAHQGYEYQDILVACRFVDMLLGGILQVYVDKKLVPDDRFDDLTTIDIVGNRERIQFKHTENDDRPLSLRTFTSDDRGLRLDRLIAAMLADRAGPGGEATTLTFRIVLRDQAPIDPGLTGVLTSLKIDPGPFVPAMRTLRLGFNAIALWNQQESGADNVAQGPFGFLFVNETRLAFSDLEWACQHLVVEVGAPAASGDLTVPNIAEHLLLMRMRSEVGAEAFPNVERTAVDVAAAMISTARAARQGRLIVTAEELLRRAQLRSDFGAVSRAHPVNQAIEVLRPSTVLQLVDVATDLANTGGKLIVVGPPGHGKSWVCHQLLNKLTDGGWLTAEHYCYLGDADGERLERVLAEAVFGSLVGRLAEADPRLVTDNRPRFAADEDALINCLWRSLDLVPNRRIALVVDGIDHITRVRARSGSGFDPSRSLAEALSLLDLPPEVVVIILSQPGSHLEPLENMGTKIVTIPGLDKHELKLLATRLNVVPSDEHKLSIEGTPLIEDAGAIAEFLSALSERSAGNALYATYLCRETLKISDTHIDPAVAVRSLPSFDGSLKNYYDHLYRSLGAEAGWVADVVALVDFAITRAEIREIRPDVAHRVDGALAVLEPVLIERATQGGVRVYHESFARYLRGPFQNDATALKALLERIADWLGRKGFFADPRAFRSLLTILSEAGHDAQVVDLVDQSFVVRAVAAGFPSSGITANLATAIGSAARLGDWPAVVRYVELARAAESFQSERFDSTLVAFADVPASLLGADTLAARLVDDDHIVMPARAGLQMCAAVDALGAAAPWRAYMTAYRREAKTDNTSYGNASDRAVALAWLRGRLRLASVILDIDSGEHSTSSETETVIHKDGNYVDDDGEWDLTEPVDLSQLAKWIKATDLPASEVISAIEDTHGLDGVVRIIHCIPNSGEFCLALAERLDREPVSDMEIGSPLLWATTAVVNGIPSGSKHRLLKLGVNPENLTNDIIAVARELLFDLTHRIQEPSIRWEDGQIDAWLDACALAAHRDQFGLNATEALIIGDGWYRCWLRFVLALSRAEAAEPSDRGSLALGALRLLTGDLNPFSGDPRSCDLYSFHGVIQDTINRAVRLLNDEQWELGLGILKDVSAAITTTLFGELNRPVPPDFLLRIVVNGASPTRRNAAEALVEDEITRGSAQRYYVDLAEYRLYGARLALAADERERAQNLLREACSFLTAYGWHKDITIYELLDPLPMLIKADPARARIRIANVQGLCERVPLHTDKKETRHAWSRWWELLAKADPVSMVHIVVPQLLSKCNEPNWLLSGALENVWEEWHEHADSLLSGALRLTLDTTLHPVDVKQFERLAKDSNINGPTIKRLMTWLLARVDERHVAYSYTNSAELVAKDDEEVAKINQIAQTVDLPPVRMLYDGVSVSESSQQNDGSSHPKLSSAAKYSMKNMSFPPGNPGLASAIRTWLRRPYDAKSPEWVVERFTNVIGYRLLELAADNRYKEVESALRSLSDGSSLRDRGEILRLVAKGFERHGEIRLAAVAYSLAWTRTRGHGGWLTFGGETDIEDLHRATTLEPNVACSIIAEEVERVVATSSYGTYGISQALIYAFSVGALNWPGQSAVDMAFAAWDEAFSIIEARAPRVDASDDPDDPYLPPDNDKGEAAPGNLEAALALAILGGLAHPGRENKRRAFLAVQLIIDERAAVAAPAFKIALGSISDPATLTWLLHLIDLANERSIPIRESCQDVFRELVARGLITVRALSRRLLSGEKPPLALPTPADNLLLDRRKNILWTPDNSSRASLGEPAGLDELIESVAGVRLQEGEQFLPGLRNAVRTRVAISLNEKSFKKQLNSQLDSLASRARKRWPDAFLAHEQTIEETLQSIATGGRTARLIDGVPILNPIAWEDELASVLLNDPTIPLILEALRQPRPNFAPPLGRGHNIWAQVRERAAGSSDMPIEEAAEQYESLSATLTIKPASSASVVESGIFKGWYWFGTMEKRLVKHPDWNRDADLVSKRYRILEVRDLGDRQALTLPPVTRGDLRMWRAGIDPYFSIPLFGTTQPLVGEDRELAMIRDGRQGLGVPDSLLTPTESLIALLNLRPGVPCTYEDKDGIGFALVTWRAEYDISDYYLAWPRTCGSGIVIRPDLLIRLVAAVGEPRLVLRDFVMGNLELLITPATESKLNGSE